VLGSSRDIPYFQLLDGFNRSCFLIHHAFNQKPPGVCDAKFNRFLNRRRVYPVLCKPVASAFFYLQNHLSNSSVTYTNS